MIPGEPSLVPPETLDDSHVLGSFESGVPALDDWLRRRARMNQQSGASRTFVLCREDRRVIGYYALAAGAIASSEAPGRLRRNMQDPIPMMVLGRLAVDGHEQSKGLGALLLRDALARTLRAAQEIGIVGVLAHAISEEAKTFYQRWGFVEAPSHPMTLVVRLKDLDA
jgi:GNAT superfamily N-acetyltransferase